MVYRQCTVPKEIARFKPVLYLIAQLFADNVLFFKDIASFKPCDEDIHRNGGRRYESKSSGSQWRH